MDERATAAVRAHLEALVAGGGQLGLQVAAYRHGELVVDAWAGVAEPATGRPVDGATLFTVYSAGKALVSTCVHLLAERGRLDYDAPVAAYWPAFAAQGKDRVTVRHALTHRAGVPLLPRGTATTPEELCDWEGMCAAIAALAPLWEPGTRMGYHALTFGWILGEVVRRVDGRPFGRFVREELGRPLGLEGQLYFGLPDAEAARVATADLGPPAAPPPAPDALAVQALPLPLRRIFNRADVRRACIPAINGLMTARALAGHYAALIGTGTAGVRLLAPARVAAATVPLPDEPDLVWGITAARALGYLLGGPEPDAFAVHAGGRRSAFGYPGIGGNIGFADPEYGLAVGIVMTTPQGGAPDARQAIAMRVREALGVPPQPAA
jgi:CubicO group peptidase (beta-lactamase class C family)